VGAAVEQCNEPNEVYADGPGPSQVIAVFCGHMMGSPSDGAVIDEFARRKVVFREKWNRLIIFQWLPLFVVFGAIGYFGLDKSFPIVVIPLLVGGCSPNKQPHNKELERARSAHFAVSPRPSIQYWTGNGVTTRGFHSAQRRPA
jgi:hypothetical protein